MGSAGVQRRKVDQNLGIRCGRAGCCQPAGNLEAPTHLQVRAEDDIRLITAAAGNPRLLRLVKRCSAQVQPVRLMLEGGGIQLQLCAKLRHLRLCRCPSCLTPGNEQEEAQSWQRLSSGGWAGSGGGHKRRCHMAKKRPTAA